MVFQFLMDLGVRILDPVLKPLLNLTPLLIILIISLIVSLAITLVYKFATDQKKMKAIKDEMKKKQKKVKEFKNDPAKAMAIQKEMMSKQKDMFTHSLKVTAITFIPMIFFFGWMYAHLAFVPIMPGDDFSMTINFAEDVKGEVEIVAPEEFEVIGDTTQEVNSDLTWELKAPMEEGDYIIDFKNKGKIVSKEVVVSNKLNYAKPVEDTWKKTFGIIKIDYEKLKPLGTKFNIFGWYPGWLALYIIFSLVFSMTARKLLKVY